MALIYRRVGDKFLIYWRAGTTCMSPKAVHQVTPQPRPERAYKLHLYRVTRRDTRAEQMQIGSPFSLFKGHKVPPKTRPVNAAEDITAAGGSYAVFLGEVESSEGLCTLSFLSDRLEGFLIGASGNLEGEGWVDGGGKGPGLGSGGVVPSRLDDAGGTGADDVKWGCAGAGAVICGWRVRGQEGCVRSARNGRIFGYVL